MNAKTFRNTLVAIAFSATGLIPAVAHADGGYFSVTFGDRGPVRDWGPPSYRGERVGPVYGWERGFSADFVDARQDRQLMRIRDGMRSGELTRKEAHSLMREQRHIDRLQDRFLADGYLDAHERHRLDEALDRSSHRIRTAKHDDDRYDDGRRGGHWPPHRHHDGWR